MVAKSACSSKKLFPGVDGAGNTKSKYSATVQTNKPVFYSRATKSYQHFARD